MTQFKKFTFALAAVVALVVWASTAKAQVAFQMSSSTRTVRVEGLSEAVGSVTLTVTTAGTMSDLSEIDLDYGVDIVGDDDDPDELPDPDDPVDEFIADADCVEPGFEIDDSHLTLTFDFAAVCTVAVGDSIVISGIRVNANDAGEGATINAKATASVPAGGFPISFFIVSQVPVAAVESAFDIDIASGKTILTCAANADGVGEEPDPLDPDNGLAVVIVIAENSNQAFSDEDDEIGYADYDGDHENTVFTVTFKDVPTDVTIELHEVNVDTPGDAALGTGLEVVGNFGTYDSDVNDDGLPDGFDGEDDDIEFEFEITRTSSTGGTEEIELIFIASTGEPIDSVNGGVSVDVGVSFAAGDLGDGPPGSVPEFEDNEVEDPGFDVSDCLTRLMFPWVVSAVAGYDTGITIANTTEDDVGFNATSDINGAEAQTGTCKLTGYPAAGGTVISYTTPSIAAGRTQPIVMSQTTGFNGFSGYVLAVCNFLNAHAFAFLIDGFGSVAGPRVAEGYTANVVNVGDRTFPAGEALGH